MRSISNTIINIRVLYRGGYILAKYVTISFSSTTLFHYLVPWLHTLLHHSHNFEIYRVTNSIANSMHLRKSISKQSNSLKYSLSQFTYIDWRTKAENNGGEIYEFKENLLRAEPFCAADLEHAITFCTKKRWNKKRPFTPTQEKESNL